MVAALEICRTTDGTRAAVTLRNVSASETAYVLEWAVPDAAGDVVAPLFRFAPGARYLGMLAKRYATRASFAGIELHALEFLGGHLPR